MTRRNAGFTLIEILVVITIIAALMGLVVAFLGKGGYVRDQTITTTRIQEIGVALNSLRSKQILGMYPPADITKLRGPKRETVGADAGAPNETNIGIESVWVAIHMDLVDVNLNENDDWIENLDEDQMGKNVTRLETMELFEYVDAWGNPLAYFSAREYKDERARAVSKYRMRDGRIVTVTPWRTEKTGAAMNQGKFQLFSAGPDEEFNTEDDIGNWGN